MNSFKSTTLFIALIFLSNHVFGQVGFIKIFNQPGADVANFVTGTSTGGFILAGSATPGSSRDAMLIRLDSNGNVLWTKCYGDIGLEYFNQVIETPDDGFMAVGKSNSYTALTSRDCPFVVKVDKDGNQLWSKVFSTLTQRNQTHGVSNGDALSIILATDGNFYIGCHEVQPTGNSANAFFIVIDGQGNLIRLMRDETDVSYTGSGNGYGNLFQTMYELADGDFLIASAPYSPSGNGRYDPGLSKVSKNGTYRFSKILGNHIWDDGSRFMQRLSNKDFLTTNASHNQARNSEYPTMYRVDETGVVKWTGTLTYPAITQLSSFGTVERDSGEYVTAIGDRSTNPGIDMALICYNESQVLWAKSYGTSKKENTSWVCKTSDGGFLVVGSSNSGGTDSTDVIIVKTDSNGNSSCDNNITGITLTTINNVVKDRANPIYSQQDHEAVANPGTTVLNPTSANVGLFLTTVSDLICTGKTDGVVSATANGAPNYSYSWNTTPTKTTAQITGLGPGTYTVTVTDANGCIKTDSANVQYTAPPTTSIDYVNDATCSSPNGSASVTATGSYGPYSYSWNTTPVTNGKNLQNAAAGNYQCQIKDTANCISTVNVTINLASTKPVFSLGPDQQICPDDSVQIGTDTIATTYTWNSGQNTAKFFAKTGGTYILHLSRNNCTYEDTIAIGIKPQAVFSLGSDFDICTGSLTTIGTSVSADSYLWNTSPPSSTPTINVSTSGRYILTTTLNNCKFSDSIDINVKPVPIFSLGSDPNACADSIFKIGTSVFADTYLWNTGEITDSISPTSSGKYKLTLTLNGCPYSDSVNVTIKPLPVFNLGQDQDICTGKTATFGTTVFANSYSWNTNPVDHNPFITISQAGTYILELIYNGCDYQDTVVLNVHPIPIFNLGQDDSLCLSSPVTIGTSKFNGSYLWNTGEKSQNITPTKSGIYVLNVTENNCTGSDTISLTFFKAPKQLDHDTAICETDTLLLDLACTGCSYLWENGDTVAFRYVSPTSGVNVMITDTNNCVYSSSMKILADERNECIIDVFAPTAFSPDGDGYNESFQLVGMYLDRIKLQIFNRWGQQIFSGDSTSPVWDGTFEGKPCELGVYVWKARVTYLTGKQKWLTGKVVIVR